MIKLIPKVSVKVRLGDFNILSRFVPLLCRPVMLI